MTNEKNTMTTRYDKDGNFHVHWDQEDWDWVVSNEDEFILTKKGGKK